MKEKAERNRRLYEFWINHPDYKLRAIAGIFHISIPRAWLIIQQEKRKEDKGR